MAVLCGINQYTIERLEKQGYRCGGLVSKDGASMVAWMKANNRENPLYDRFDRVVAIMKKYNVVFSLGTAQRRQGLNPRRHGYFPVIPHAMRAPPPPKGLGSSE